jgi:hypothetical protein
MKWQRKHQAHPGLGDRSTVHFSRWDRTHHGSAPELSTVSGTMTFYRQFYAFPLHRTVPYTLDKSSLRSPLSYWWRNRGPRNQGLLNSWHLKPMFLAAVLWAPTHPVIFLRTIFNF